MSWSMHAVLCSISHLFYVAFTCYVVLVCLINRQDRRRKESAILDMMHEAVSFEGDPWSNR